MSIWTIQAEYQAPDVANKQLEYFGSTNEIKFVGGTAATWGNVTSTGSWPPFPQAYYGTEVSSGRRFTILVNPRDAVICALEPKDDISPASGGSWTADDG